MLALMFNKSDNEDKKCTAKNFPVFKCVNIFCSVFFSNKIQHATFHHSLRLLHALLIRTLNEASLDTLLIQFCHNMYTNSLSGEVEMLSED